MYMRAFQETPQSPNEKVWTVCGTGPVHHEDDGLSLAQADAVLIKNAPTDIARLIAAHKIMREALEKVIARTEWRIEKTPMNFCLDDCPKDCGEHTIFNDVKRRTLDNGNYAREALSAVDAL